MKQVCICTFCVWNSYGSMLQAYGLQYALKQLDCRGTIASTKPEPAKKWIFPGLKTRSVKGMVVDLHRMLISRKLKRKYSACGSFIRRNINIDYFGSFEALAEAPPRADVYLAGSDQVWNPRKMDPAFFLEFVPEGYPRITYGASMGIPKIPAGKEGDFRRLVRGFDHISLRERDNVPVVGAYTDQMPEVHIDPVFLVPQEHWREMEQPYPIDEPYILVYPIYWEKGLNRQLKALHKKTGKTIVAVLGQAQQVYANRRIYDASPEQFLWLIDHADAVVSSSFHGIAMSLVFEKPFSAVIDPKSPSRLRCLLETLETGNRAIPDLADDAARNYDGLREKINLERGRSMAYLGKVLNIQ